MVQSERNVGKHLNEIKLKFIPFALLNWNRSLASLLLVVTQSLYTVSYTRCIGRNSISVKDSICKLFNFFVCSPSTVFSQKLQSQKQVNSKWNTHKNAFNIFGSYCSLFSHRLCSLFILNYYSRNKKKAAKKFLVFELIGFSFHFPSSHFCCKQHFFHLKWGEKKCSFRYTILKAMQWLY